MPRKKKPRPTIPEPLESTAEIITRLTTTNGIPAIQLPKIHNIVASFFSGQRIDVRTVAQYARNVEKKPRFNGVIMRGRNPKYTCLLFSSGACNIMGVRTLADGKLAARKVARGLQKIGYPVARVENWYPVNFVASAETGMVIRIPGLYRKHGLSPYVRYMPEHFSGLIYEYLGNEEGTRGKVTVIVFSNGKLMFLGARYEQHIFYAFEHIYPIIAEFAIRSRQGSKVE
ncbi:TATA-box binding protein-like protein [Microthyrium microscopicum]|uniref:TATA-box binding protein-like protein n=1 Tax=Microthyrium microscopicum TaxID=703497 RepID=A0A6A6UEK0_9PEZI|nr:TATA-box binding protein-like protein [Microthyrium microscopicum]